MLNWFSNFRDALTLVSEYRSAKLGSINSDSRWFGILGGRRSSADVTVSEEVALKIATIYSCANVLAETIAAMPVNIHRQSPSGRSIDTSHPAFFLIKKKANPNTTAYVFWKTIVTHVAIWGNGYAEIERDSFQNPVALNLLMPWDVRIQEMNGEFFYFHGNRFIETDNLLHFKIYSKDGVMGISPVMQNYEATGLAVRYQEYIGETLGDKIPAYLSSESPTVDEEKAKNIKDFFKKQVSEKKRGELPFLYGGVKYNPIMIPPGDAEYIAGRQLNKEDIYGIFRVPPTFVQNYERATFSNAEMQDLVLMKHTVTPWITNIEQELESKLLKESEKTGEVTWFVKHNMNGILRADIKTRFEAYRILWNIGVLSDTMIYDLEDWDTSETTGLKMVPANMIALSEAENWSKALVKKANEQGVSTRELKEMADIAGIDLDKLGLNGNERLHQS